MEEIDKKLIEKIESGLTKKLREFDQKILELSKSVEELKSDLIKKEKEVTKLTSKARKTAGAAALPPLQEIEEMRNKFKEINEKLLKFENLVKRHGIKNVDDLLTELEEKISEIKKIEKVVISQASKVSNISSQIDLELGNLNEIRKRLNETISPFSKRLNLIEMRLGQFVEKEGFEEFKERTKSELYKLTKLEEPSQIIEDLKTIKSFFSEKIDSISEIKFIALLGILPFIKNKDKVSKIVEELGIIVNELKEKKLWDMEKESLMKEILHNLKTGGGHELL